MHRDATIARVPERGVMQWQPFERRELGAAARGRRGNVERLDGVDQTGSLGAACLLAGAPEERCGAQEDRVRGRSHWGGTVAEQALCTMRASYFTRVKRDRTWSNPSDFMALTATMYRFDIDLSDVDRSVYERLDLRVARHPSETMRYLLTRVLAYCLCHEEGIAFTRGLAVAEEPAVWVKDLQGNTQVWIEVGAPSAERLHKATKAVPRVAVFTHHAIELLDRMVRASHVHRAEEIACYAIDPAFLDALEPLVSRKSTWTLARNDGELYVTVGDQSLSTRIDRHALG